MSAASESGRGTGGAPAERGDHTVFVLDDDDAVRAGLELLLKAVGHRVVAFRDARAFLAAYDAAVPGCLLLDLRMPGYSGLEVQSALGAGGYHVPIIFLTGHGDVPATAHALRAGAVDFLEKPYDTATLLARIEEAFQIDRNARLAETERRDFDARLATLTPREHQILELVVAGQASKVIAADLGISERTVELHRARSMKKMGSRTSAELMRLMLVHEPPGKAGA